MYKPDKERLTAYVRGEGDSKHFDWHAWLKDLDPEERSLLTREVLSARSRRDLSDYARQFYLHFCTNTEDGRLRSIEREFVIAQIEEHKPEAIAELEDVYFNRARELIKTSEEESHED
jgi:hypothetical protein